MSLTQNRIRIGAVACLAIVAIAGASTFVTDVAGGGPRLTSLGILLATVIASVECYLAFRLLRSGVYTRPRALNLLSRVATWGTLAIAIVILFQPQWDNLGR